MFLKKRFLSALILIIVITIISSNGPTVLATSSFTDVPSNYKDATSTSSPTATYAIDEEKQADTMPLSQPSDTITRAEAVKLIITTIIDENTTTLETTNKLSDVPEHHWANKYISFAQELGIINSYPDQTFKPDFPISYGEIVKMLVCAKDFSDKYKPTTPWYEGYIELASQLGITKDIACSGDWKVSKDLVSRLIHNFTNEQSIPVIYFSGDFSDLTSKKNEKNITVTYQSNNLSFDAFAKIKLQGTSSIYYPKKNYTVKFYTDNTYAEKKDIDVGWGEQSKYCLKANWIDKTHSRNIVTAKLVTQMQKKYNVLNDAPANGAIDGFPVEVYINNAYHGLYTLNIPKDEWMFNMDSSDPNNIVVVGEDWNPETRFKAKPNLTMWEVEVGKENDYILDKMNRLFDFVMNSSNNEFKAHLEEYLSLDATLNYYIMPDFAYLLDNLGKYMILATYDGNVWYPCLYDLDTSWGTNSTGDGILSYEKYLVGFDYNRLLERIEQCFPDKLSKRYFELRQDILTKNNILFKFNSFKNLISETAYEKELLKWGPILPGYEFSQIEEFLDNMMPRLDKKYDYMKRRAVIQ